MIEFGIAQMPKFQDGKWYLVGRCVTDIRVGCRFTESIPHTPSPAKDNLALPPPNGTPTTVSLEIEKIIAYGKEVTFWSKGCTALVIAVGDGENLTDFCTLRG